MFREVLKIVPQVERGALNQMESQLNSRFSKVAKKFGRGLVQVLKGGGVLGATIALVDKFLNPLKDVQEAIERTLSRADDVVTQAGQFNTTPGKLFKLQRLAQSAGLDEQTLSQMLIKFQGALAEAEADPSKPSSVREFVGYSPDTVETFFRYIQELRELQKTNPNAANLAQQETFGEKLILKMSDFVQQDQRKVLRELRLPDSEVLDKDLNSQATLADLKDLLASRRESDDLRVKSRSITEGTIREQDKVERLRLKNENQNVENFKDLSGVEQAALQVTGLLNQLIAQTGKLLLHSTDILKIIQTISGSPNLRNFLGKGR